MSFALPCPARPSRIAPSALLLLLAALAPQPALASKPRVRLERAEAGGCGREPFLEVHFAELELEGQLRRRPPSEYRLLLDGQGLAVRPSRVSSYAQSGRPLRLALVVQSTASYGGAMDRLRAGLQDLVRAMPRGVRISVIAYDSRARRLLLGGEPRQALAALDGLEAIGAGADLALDEALTLALRSLGPADPAQRRLLVLVSDGVNRFPKRDVFRGLGNRARALGVPIQPVGFSPIDERGPLLNLGELAKRSLGTMRWAQRAEDLPVQLGNLAHEIRGQLVLRFPWPAGCHRVARLQVSAGDLVSNALELDPATGGPPPPAGRSRLALALFLGGLASAALLLTLAARALVRPRRRPPLAGEEVPPRRSRPPRPRR